MDCLEHEILKIKDEFEYDEDFISMTVLSYTKHNVEHYLINPTKRAQMLNSCLLVNCVMLTMLVASLYGIQTNENDYYNSDVPSTHVLWFVKFPCAVALHLSLTPQISNGLAIMKFSNNQADIFVEYGSEISFFLGLSEVTLGMLCQYCNI
jgi:hypothetical protein